MLANFINDYFSMIIIVCIILHILIGIYLNKIYYKRENKKTPMAFIPLANLYLIGSLSLHNVVGWILVIITILNSSYPITVDDKVIIKRILPENINESLWLITIIFIILLLIVLIFKQANYKKDNIIRDDSFLTEFELMKEPSYLKKQAKLNYKNNSLERKDNILISNDTPKAFPESRFSNNQVSQNIQQPRNNNPQMPKPFNSQPFSNQNQLPNNNPFNNRKF